MTEPAPYPVVASFEAEGLRSTVYAIQGRFHVCLKDTEADASLPSIMIYPDREKAVAYARSLIAEPQVIVSSNLAIDCNAGSALSA